jgi:hypothetical protein
VVSVADCYPRGAGFDYRVALGIFPLRKRVLSTLVCQTNLGKEACLSRNPKRLLCQYLLFIVHAETTKNKMQAEGQAISAEKYYFLGRINDISWKNTFTT